MPRSVRLRVDSALFSILLVTTVSGVRAADSGYFKGIKSTGTVWLQIGPAIFKSCKRIDWYQARPPLQTGENQSSGVGNRSQWIEMDITRVDKLSTATSLSQWATTRDLHREA